MNNSNLIPNSERTPEELREMCRKGGKASGVARRKKKAMKEQIELLLSLPIKDKATIKQMKALGINTDNIDNQMALLISVFKKGIKTGDKSVAEFFRDTTDGKPTENLKVDDTRNNKFEEICSQIGGEGLNE